MAGMHVYRERRGITTNEAQYAIQSAMEARANLPFSTTPGAYAVTDAAGKGAVHTHPSYLYLEKLLGLGLGLGLLKCGKRLHGFST